MPIKKSSTPKPEAAKAPETTTNVKQKTDSKPKATSTSAAATHKASARKPAQPTAPAAASAAGFDAAFHHEEIAREAYQLWLNRGCQHGQAHEDWLRAIEVVRVRYNG